LLGTGIPPFFNGMAFQATATGGILFWLNSNGAIARPSCTVHRLPTRPRLAACRLSRASPATPSASGQTMCSSALAT
jgi:hypothetical protein